MKTKDTIAMERLLNGYAISYAFAFDECCNKIKRHHESDAQGFFIKLMNEITEMDFDYLKEAAKYNDNGCKYSREIMNFIVAMHKEYHRFLHKYLRCIPIHHKSNSDMQWYANAIICTIKRKMQLEIDVIVKRRNYDLPMYKDYLKRTHDDEN